MCIRYAMGRSWRCARLRIGRMRCAGWGSSVGLVRSQFPIHHIGVRVAQSWVKKRVGKAADDLKAVFLPEADGAIVIADNEVELHRSKITCTGLFDRVDTHRAGNSAADGGRRGHVSTIRHMRSAASLACPQVVRAEYDAILFGDEDFVLRVQPV